ncbi:hypothetical protein TREMEDRAFT_67963 [Tremella mesenterica DSM 1558]|uniref:uncharacterized protein n=1 Tax=Tremella mesenterica (strain ATCC 24925 / CBS 8224 / DSM 1558 / NBRC 9311 / NRRL Y-6157 / RJB 2259-6 / UBC 559-6) TaxID=578456 RepID=UPI0003F49CC0|nr:uncharacterized protein TREMEDRAFT_67963 [Tremella mesenterica DSM 1558]EIW71794.1 hypothetical protein TREMEDRAFT_67963 [Tremella mesenterica DSM 1558]
MPIHVNTPAPTVTSPRDHPLLNNILSRNLPPKRRSVQQAWASTLMASTHEKSNVWLDNLFHATLEASSVPEMVVTSRERVDDTLERLFSDMSVSKDIVLTFLDLLAFLHKERHPMPTRVLDAARTCALERWKEDTNSLGDLKQPVPAIVIWYAEQDTERNLCAENIANLVEVNISPGYDAAWSSLQLLRDDFDNPPDPMWITQLSHWESALWHQQRADEITGGTSFGSFNTRLICHHALGDFEKGYRLAQSLFEGLNDHQRRQTAHWATAAAWHMNDYETMADYLAFHPKGTSKSIYKAIIDVQHGQYGSAFQHIRKAQSLSYDELQAQLTVGPQVALKTLAKTEILVELKEVITYKSQPEQRVQILDIWRARFRKSHPDVNTWLKRLGVWGLAAPPTTLQLQLCYIDCAKLCESKGMTEAAKWIMEMITPKQFQPGDNVEYTKMRFLWKDATLSGATKAQQVTLNQMHEHTAKLVEHLSIDRTALESEGLGLRPLTTAAALSSIDRESLARRYCRLAEWTETCQGPDWVADPDSEVYRYYSLAYKLDPGWFVASYSLSQAAMNIFEGNNCSRQDPIAVNNYVVPAIRGLFQAVRSPESPEKGIKALLRLVTLWHRFGESESVLLEVSAQLGETSVASWLNAIPQLIARLGTKHRDLQALLIELLKNIANQFPHAVIWPLLTASQTKVHDAHDKNEGGARVIMDHICSMPNGTRLISQAELVGTELIRTSVSWLEKWRNLIDRCLPRTDLMEIAWHELPAMWQPEIAKLDCPETPDEENFRQMFGARIASINKTLIKYASSRTLSLVHTAYSDLYKLFGEIDAQLSQWRVPGTKLQLATAAPKLLSLRDCILTVPGQYDPNIKLDDQAFIQRFHPTMDILTSKMLPRKLVIQSHHKDYTFLLKGNEDLRGDERIMQLFTLINTLLNHEQEAFDRNLHLLPYEVVPLSPSAGLVSWVPNTTQLQALIQSNRDKDRGSNLANKELASLLGYDPETFDPKRDNPRLDPPAESDRYDKLPLDTKVKRLQAALSHSNQSDLKDVLWQRSPSAELWIRRRTNFSRTIGVGSFVGYIIGLGDRHGLNILVDQLTWGALHIDFGDLFGVAQERSFLPEKVPFRLTRMMTNAFELASHVPKDMAPGSRGSFKQASIVTMNVLRESRSTLLAMLEAFLYDPLLSWTGHVGPSGASGGFATAPAGSARSDHNIYNTIENSLIAAYLESDSYMAKAGAGGMTNQKALSVLAEIERKLAGHDQVTGEVIPVKQQVQQLIEEATDLRNLSQGYVLGWIPHW